jgi:hypothetical protein
MFGPSNWLVGIPLDVSVEEKGRLLPPDLKPVMHPWLVGSRCSGKEHDGIGDAVELIRYQQHLSPGDSCALNAAIGAFVPNISETFGWRGVLDSAKGEPCYGKQNQETR